MSFLKKIIHFYIFFLLFSISWSPLFGIADISSLKNNTCLTKNLSEIYTRNANNTLLGHNLDESSCQQIHNSKHKVNYLKDNICLPLDNLNGGIADSAWPMFCHDTKHTGLSPYNTNNNPYEEIWRIKTEGSCDSGIVIDENGMLYATSFNGMLYCIYPNGTIKWTYGDIGVFTTSTPCIGNDGTIYVGSFDDGALHAVNPDGSQKWRRRFISSVASSPAIADDGTIYVGTQGGIHPLGNSMIALNQNGTIKWQYRTGESVLSDPAILDDGTIIFGSLDSYIYSLYPNGTLKWRYKTGNWVKGPASIDDQGIIYINSLDKYLYALYANGTLKWRTENGEWWGTETNPSFGPDGTIYVAGDFVEALNPVDGSVLWRFSFTNRDEYTYLSSPVVSADGTIYVGTMIDGIWGGCLYAINPNGNLEWTKRIADIYVASTPSIGSDGTIYIGSCWEDGGAIHAFGKWNGTNHPPETPTVEGEERALVWTEYELKITDVDEDLHPMKYVIDWGDGTTTETIEIASEYQYLVTHQYRFIPWSYKIRVKAVDTLGLESDWTEHTVRTAWFPPFEYCREWIIWFISEFFDSGEV